MDRGTARINFHYSEPLSFFTGMTCSCGAIWKYEGLVNKADALRRAEFHLMQHADEKLTYYRRIADIDLYDI